MELSPRLYFSYSQFLVYDQTVHEPGLLWSDVHVGQGFARRDSTVSFSTLHDDGFADVTYTVGRFVSLHSYARVIEVPFFTVSGRICVNGPEEGDDRILQLVPGHYRLVAAQRRTGEQEQAISLSFERLESPLSGSNVLVADDELRVPDVLLESADVA